MNYDNTAEAYPELKITHNVIAAGEDKGSKASFFFGLCSGKREPVWKREKWLTLKDPAVKYWWNEPAAVTREAGRPAAGWCSIFKTCTLSRPHFCWTHTLRASIVFRLVATASSSFSVSDTEHLGGAFKRSTQEHVQNLSLKRRHIATTYVITYIWSEVTNSSKPLRPTHFVSNFTFSSMGCASEGCSTNLWNHSQEAHPTEWETSSYEES